MKKQRIKERSAAVLTIKDGDKMTKRGVRNVSKWLRNQADWFEKYAGELSPTFRARYQYDGGAV